MNKTISSAMQRNLKQSFTEVFTYFTKEQTATDQQTACLYKWGRQLGITPSELREFQESNTTYAYQYSTTEAIGFAYDLVCLVYMDEVVEDSELKLATHFAENVLGLKPHVVNNLLKALITAQLESIPNEELRGDITIHPEVYV
jgi:hypothetical protein